MLHIEKKGHNPRRAAIGVGAFALLIVGSYTLVNVLSPTLAPILAPTTVDVHALAQPSRSKNQVVIPKLGLQISYASGDESVLDRGAWWRYPERGSPANGGNFIIAAHRFSIQPTPGGTIEKSPFYHIDKLVIGDQIVTDYNGKRYVYEVEKIFDVKPSQTEIEAPSSEAKLTLYSCELGGSDAGRVVVVAKKLGEATTTD
ncbi:MAG: class E sortase [Candidatus Saccharimonas sp.]